MAVRLSLRPALQYVHQLAEEASCEQASDRQLLQQFVQSGDQDAFRVLVRRHGALVFGVSLRTLRHRQDAEDCFQAAFLVLARKAASVQWQESIAPWLYQVATRLALELRSSPRRRHQALQSDMSETVSDGLALRELATVLDEEITRLPERCRGPILLCYLQGQTRAHAAKMLGVPLRTLERRLVEARKRLRDRLTRRGLTLSACIAAWSVTQDAGAAIGPALVNTAAAAACAFARGSLASSAAELATQMLGSIAWAKIRWTIGAVIAATVCALTIGLAGVSSNAHPPRRENDPIQPLPIAQEKNPDRANVKIRLQEIATASAVERGLSWIERQQNEDGSWRLDAAQPNDIAATALALLPLLEATNNPARPRAAAQETSIHNGLKFLVGKQKADGSFDGGMYAHAMAAWALSDGYRWTKDAQFKKPAQQALEFIVRAQHEQGGWRYTPNTPGDTSVTSWHIIALKAGQRAGFAVPADTFKKASAFLDSVSLDSKTTYSYTPRGPATASMTGAGLYCRQLLGWERGDKTLEQGAVRLQKLSAEPRTLNAYHHHFATRTFQGVGGEFWKAWEARVVTFLIERQERGGPVEGSWPPQGDVYGSAGGRLMVTSLSLLALQQCGKFDSPIAPLRELSPADIAARWEILRGDDFGKVRPAMQELIGSPVQSMTFLRKSLHPAQAADAKKIKALIEDLGATTFPTRNRAFEQLKALGEPTIPALRQALKGNPEVELRRRVENLLEFATNQARSPERIRDLRGVQILEMIGSEGARELLDRLAAGAANIGVTRAANDAAIRLRSR